jgi:hypothetical protein
MKKNDIEKLNCVNLRRSWSVGEKDYLREILNIKDENGIRKYTPRIIGFANLEIFYGRTPGAVERKAKEILDALDE